MNKTLNEIIKLAKETLEVAEAKVIDTEVEALDRRAFISIGGKLDMIILTAEDALIPDPRQDNVDRPDRHNIAGTMNSPSEMQKKAFNIAVSATGTVDKSDEV